MATIDPGLRAEAMEDLVRTILSVTRERDPTFPRRVAEALEAELRTRPGDVALEHAYSVAMGVVS